MSSSDAGARDATTTVHVFTSRKPLPPDAPLTIFQHIPNAAGESMIAAIKANHRERHAVRLPVPSGADAGDRLWRGLVRAIPKQRRRHVAGVAGVHAAHLIGSCGREVRALALLRDPLDLVVSALGTAELSVASVYGDRPPVEWRNPQARALLRSHYDLAALDDVGAQDAEADVWRERLVDVVSRHYTLGRTDRFVRSLEVFARQLRWGVLMAPTINVRRAGADVPRLGLDDTKALRRWLWLDLELFDSFGAALADPPVSSAKKMKDRTSPISDDVIAPRYQGDPLSPGGGTASLTAFRLAALERRLRDLDPNAAPAFDPMDSSVSEGEQETSGDVAVTPALKDDKYLLGNDGWLFLANDSNAVVDQHVGRRRLTAAEVAAWTTALAQRTERLRELGADYQFCVPPNPHAVYPEHLPDWIERRANRPIEQLLAAWVGASPATTVYPLDAMQARKGSREPYTSNDSHWNDFGAWIGYDALCELLGATHELRRVREDDVEWREEEVVGDLGGKLRPARVATGVFGTVREPSAVLRSDNLVRNNGRVLVYENAEAPPTTCVVFGDSFCYVMVKYLRETFRRTVITHHSHAVDFEFVATERPDVVLTVVNERFLIRVPCDDDALSLAQVHARKRALGLVLDPAAAREHKSGDLQTDDDVHRQPPALQTAAQGGSD